ncbi:junctional adhesion molecule B isoform X1 [Erpetoichthys calabaricus]|uniref:junctional adhesion molecule B isoform X1 n=1 Tax=Erpetoichthys calabaricus TaxID=27687 RepID=UPI0010A0BEA2|nr:junctional adhesion molecule B isoform X1 [Erpetoichthys calabaricus]
MAALQHVLLQLCAVLLSVHRCSLVTVTSRTPTVQVEEHGEAVLSCVYTVERDRNPRVEWKKINKEDPSFVYFGGAVVGDFSGRAEMEGANIRIKQVTMKDSGQYRCEVSAKDDRNPLGEVTVTLSVLVPANIPSCEIPSTALTGSVVDLKCREQHGTPPSNYSWFKDGVLLPVTPQLDARFANSSYMLNRRTGTLQFKRAAKGDTGNYYCEAFNGVGVPQRCNPKHMQIDDLNVPGIVAAVVVLALIISLCGLGAYFAQRSGYFGRGRTRRSFWIPQYEDINQINQPALHKPMQINEANQYRAPPQEYTQDFKHTQSFML